MKKKIVKRSILGVGITDADMSDILEYVGGIVDQESQKCFIVTPNPEMIVYATKHKSFQETLNSADIALCDGAGLFLAGQFLGQPLKARIAGVDLMDDLCKKASEKAMSIGLLGGGPGVAEKAAKCLREKYRKLDIAFAQSEWESKDFPKSGVDILFVAYGFPKQEEWVATHLPHLNCKVAMGVGGAFDYLSGNVSRAPFLLRSIGLEWAYRLIRQPWRWRRQLNLIQFISLVIRARF